CFSGIRSTKYRRCLSLSCHQLLLGQLAQFLDMRFQPTGFGPVIYFKLPCKSERPLAPEAFGTGFARLMLLQSSVRVCTDTRIKITSPCSQNIDKPAYISTRSTHVKRPHCWKFWLFACINARLKPTGWQKLPAP